MNLDHDFPQGNPSAIFGRHCQRRKVENDRGALLCRTCDGPAHLVSPGSER